MGPASPFLIVSDAVAAANFYRDHLGFDVRLLIPESEPFFAVVGRDDIQILLKHVDDAVGPLPNRDRHEWAPWDVFVYHTNPEHYAEELNQRNTDLLHETHDREDGLRGFEVADLDGYVLFFGYPRSI